jgi:hypothetical protein
MAIVNRVATPTPTMAQSLPMTGLASPYDGTSPLIAANTGGVPITGSPTGTLPGLATGGRPQVNATNQTALAPNGDVNQTVTNENQYVNKYYNIIVPNQGLLGGLGGWGGLGGMFGGWNTPGNSFIDPKTGVLYVQKESGIGGWLKRLFRGY